MIRYLTVTSLMSAQMAEISVHVEKPVSRWCRVLPGMPESPARVADIILLLSGTSKQDVIVADVVSTLCRKPNATDGFYFELNQAETAKRNVYKAYDITLHHFFPLAFGRTNILSRETLRFCDFVGNYFHKSLRVPDRLRATFSRSITSGVAATFNDVIRRLQLSAANLRAYSMIPPVPDSRQQLNSSAQLAKAYAPLTRVSVRHFRDFLVGLVSRAPATSTPSESELIGAHDTENFIQDLNGHP